jgi:hypothetical protein
VPLTGILTPLEDKLQSLSSKLVVSGCNRGGAAEWGQQQQRPQLKNVTGIGSVIA